MPRPKEETGAVRPAAGASGETGFAALEAKVEEVQVEAAIEAELVAEDDAALAAAALSAAVAAAALSPAPAPLAVLPPPARAEIPPAPSLAEPFMAAARLQADTLGRLARARGLQDLFDVQVQYGRGLVELYVSNLTRVLRLVSVPATLSGWTARPSARP